MGDNSPPLNAQIPIHNNLRMKKSLDDFSIAYVEEFDPREVLNEEEGETTPPPIMRQQQQQSFSQLSQMHMMNHPMIPTRLSLSQQGSLVNMSKQAYLTRSDGYPQQQQQQQQFVAPPQQIPSLQTYQSSSRLMQQQQIPQIPQIQPTISEDQLQIIRQQQQIQAQQLQLQQLQQQHQQLLQHQQQQQVQQQQQAQELEQLEILKQQQEELIQQQQQQRLRSGLRASSDLNASPEMNEYVMPDENAPMQRSLSMQSMASSMDDTISRSGSTLDFMGQFSDEKRFLSDLCVQLHSSGSPSFRTEQRLQRAGVALGFICEPYVMLNSVIISFNDRSLAASSSETHILRAAWGLNAYKLYLVDQLAHDVSSRSVTFEDAVDRLKSIKNDDLSYHWLLQILAYGFSGACISALWYGGGWADFLVSLLLGCVVGCIQVFARKRKIVSNIIDLIAATVCAFCSRLLVEVSGGAVCFAATALPPISWLLPGFGITTAVLEISVKHVTTGTTRLAGALLTAFQLGFGLTIGNQAVFFSNSELGNCDRDMPWGGYYTVPAYYLVISICFLILLSAHRRQWISMLSVSSAGFTVYYILKLFAPTASIAVVVAAFLIGLITSLYEKITRRTAIALTVNGILMFVPGGIAVKSIYQSISGTSADGSAFGMNVLMIAISIGVGIFIASFVTQILPKSLKRRAKGKHKHSKPHSHDNENRGINIEMSNQTPSPNQVEIPVRSNV